MAVNDDGVCPFVFEFGPNETKANMCSSNFELLGCLLWIPKEINTNIFSSAELACVPLSSDRCHTCGDCFVVYGAKIGSRLEIMKLFCCAVCVELYALEMDACVCVIDIRLERGNPYDRMWVLPRDNTNIEDF